MPGRQSAPTDHLLLIAAATMIFMGAQRYLRPHAAPPLPRRAQVPAVQDGKPATLQPGPDAAEVARPGWIDVLRQTYARADQDRLLATAGGVVFFGLLAVFPAITALVSFYGLFADPSTIGDNLQRLALMLPEGSFQIVQDQIARVLEKGNTALGATFLFGLALAIWSANAGVKAVIDALNVAYEERETRGFVRLNLLALAFTSGGIAALLLMVGAVVAVPLALDHIGLAPESRIIVSLGRWPLLLVILLAGLGLLYRFGPSRPAVRRRALSVGAVVAALLWIGGSALLSWYLSNFGNYDATYGSLGAAIGLMMWMWMSAVIVLLGAELNSEIERRTAPHPASGRPTSSGSGGPSRRMRSSRRGRPCKRTLLFESTLMLS